MAKKNAAMPEVQEIDHIIDKVIEEEIDMKDKEKKKGRIARLRAFLFNRGAEKRFRKENGHGADGEELKEKSEKNSRKLNEYLDAIENQLDKVDEQNKVLLFHLSTVKENNEALLNQVSILSKNNDLLFEQFKASKRREKIAKIIAIISSSLAAVYGVYRLVDLIIKLANGG